MHIMKITTALPAAYEAPKIRVIEIDIESLLCMSNEESTTTPEENLF